MIARVLGDYCYLYESRATDSALRVRRGGGVVTALLLDALERRKIDEALVTQSASSPPWAAPVIARTADEIRAASGSKYTRVSLNRLVSSLGKRSALVGLPCQTRALARRTSAIRVGLFCGLGLSPRGIRYLLRHLGVSEEDVATLDYRAPGGGLHVRLSSGREIRYDSYYWLSYFFSYKDCLACTDFSNHKADIAVGDRTPGWSNVIVRSERGGKLFAAAISRGAIEARELTYEEFLAKTTSSLAQKEAFGGYRNCRLVRTYGRWIEHVPLRILRSAGMLIYRRTRRLQLPEEGHEKK